MILLNFTHPLTRDQIKQLEDRAGDVVERVIDAQPDFDHERPFAGQVAALVDSLDLTATEWQTVPLLVVPPSLNFIAVTLLAELHGRTGYFPTVVRLRPVAGGVLTRYEVAEITNLERVRDEARGRRGREPSD